MKKKVRMLLSVIMTISIIVAIGNISFVNAKSDNSISQEDIEMIF